MKRSNGLREKRERGRIFSNDKSTLIVRVTVTLGRERTKKSHQPLNLEISRVS